MNRYLVVDLIDNIIYNTNDLKYILDENEFDRFGGSVACLDKQDLLNELENIVAELKESELNDK